MIVIHIFGRSNTGKTTLIEALCRQLTVQGRVETIKHSGHHTLPLEEGKDTTLHFQAGASGACAIDEEKSILILAEEDLAHALDAASDRGTDFCIVEGFKAVPIPGIALGDLEGEHIIMRNPGVEEIHMNLGMFPVWTTPKVILDSLLRRSGPEATGSLLILQEAESQALADAAAAALRIPGITGAEGKMLHTGCGEAFQGTEGCLAVVGDTIKGVALALNRCAALLSDSAEDRNY